MKVSIVVPSKGCKYLRQASVASFDRTTAWIRHPRVEPRLEKRDGKPHVVI